MSTMAPNGGIVNAREFLAFAADNQEVAVPPGMVLIQDELRWTHDVDNPEKGWMLATIFFAVTPAGTVRLWTHGRLRDHQVCS